MEQQELQDPQDTAELMDSLDEESAQQAVRVKSVYEGLVTVAKTGGKLYRTNGRRANMMKFGLTTHSVSVGSTFIIKNGTLRMPVLETAAVRVDMTGLPWLTEEERNIDPVELFRRHWSSRPNGAEKFMSSNFQAKDIDEMTDDEILAGEPRGEARVRLEAWVLCAAMDGTLERYIRSQPGWTDSMWWWSPKTGSPDTPEIVIKKEWWYKPYAVAWDVASESDKTYIVAYNGSRIAAILPDADPMTVRAIQSVPLLMRLAKSMSREMLALQRRAKCYDADLLVCELSHAIDYIETGHKRNA